VNPTDFATNPPYSMWRSLLRSVLFVVLGLIIAYPLSRGLSFYRAGADARIDHLDFRLLSPGGFIGHGYGVVGTGLILTNLTYLARRRLSFLPLGSLSAWLDLHTVTGIGGSILVLFHSAFQLRTPIATVTSVSLAIVVATGLVGRYIYALTPRKGEQTLDDRLDELDTTAPSFATGIRGVIGEVKVANLPPGASMISVLLAVPRWMLEARRRRSVVARVAKADPTLIALRKAGEKKFVRWIVSDVARLWAGEIDRLAGGSLLRLWRSLHRITAILMILSVALHIGVAWFYGYRWIFTKQ
jgi:hypothetical protein